MNEPFVRVLGTADWHQTTHNDHSCYTVSDRILIDACPSVVTQLQEAGVEPLDVRLVLMTHMHCDHYMGLAPLMHYWRVCRQTDLSGLTMPGRGRPCRTMWTSRCALYSAMSSMPA